MKIRILMLSLIGLIFFNSCSTDNNSTNSTSQNLDPNTILPKKIIKDEVNGNSMFYEFFYNQNKINYIQIGSEFGVPYKCYFTYTGNLITNIQFGENGYVNGYIDFTYQNNQLVNKKYTFFSNIGGTVQTSINNIDYVYGSNNSISVSSDGILKTTYNLINGLIMNKDGGYVSYNSTSSPYKNVLGIKESFLDLGYTLYTPSIYTDFWGVDTLFSSTIRNIISIRSLQIFFPESHFSYTYNDILFPTKIIRYYGSVNGVIKYDRTYNIFYQ